MTKYRSLVIFQQQKFVLTVLEAEKSKLKEQVILVPSKALPCLFTLTPSDAKDMGIFLSSL